MLAKIKRCAKIREFSVCGFTACARVKYAMGHSTLQKQSTTVDFSCIFVKLKLKIYVDVIV